MNTEPITPHSTPTLGRPQQDAARLSRMERLGLFVHREGDKRLTALGVALYRWTKGRITPAKVDALLLTTRGRNDLLFRRLIEACGQGVVVRLSDVCSYKARARAHGTVRVGPAGDGEQ